MLECGVVKVSQRQKLVNNDKLGNKRWLSQHRCLFFILVLTAVLFFNYISKKDIAPEWYPKQWVQNHSTKPFFPTVKQNIASDNTNGSKANTTAAADTAGITTKATLATLPQTQNISSKHELNMKNQTTVTVKMIQQVPQTQPAQMTPVPYVNPGPYLVEYPYEYHFTINEAHRCEQEKPFVVFMIHVAPHNRAHRDAVRSTWGSEGLVLDKVMRVFFLLGMQTGGDAQQVHKRLMQESKEHRDLIQSDFVDSYKNLTIKTMVMLEWLNLFCSNASYAMKVDSDIFVNVPKMVKLLQEAPKTNYMIGRVVHSTPVLRDPDYRWYVPEEILPDSTYPPYAFGLGYIVSLDLPKKLIEASRHVKAIYIEDAYLGLCMKHLGILPIDPPEMDYFNSDPLTYSPCSLLKLIAVTLDPSVDRVKMWKDFKEKTKDC